MEISPSTVAQVVLLSRELDVGLGGVEPDEPEPDSAEEAPAGDTAETELHALIAGLNEDEQAELVAIMWIGRETFTPEDFAEALQTAREEHPGPVAPYLLSVPLLGDYLEDGLSALGHDVTELNDGV